jgi:putative transposase
MDFVSDQLADGRRFRCLTLVDDFTRQCLAIHVDTSIGGAAVADLLASLVAQRGQPAIITTDNGPELICRALHRWAQANSITLNPIQPGKPTQNAFIERFNGTFRDDCLNSIGSVRSPKLACSSRTGAPNTTAFALTPQSAASRLMPSP